MSSALPSLLVISMKHIFGYVIILNGSLICVNVYFLTLIQSYGCKVHLPLTLGKDANDFVLFFM